MKILILYSSTDGQTKIISQKIREILSFNNEVKVCSIQNYFNSSLDSFDKIVKANQDLENRKILGPAVIIP